jgi:hypothetical protein
MTEIPIAVGDGEAQIRFPKGQESFLREHRELHRLLKTVFCSILQTYVLSFV